MRALALAAILACGCARRSEAIRAVAEGDGAPGDAVAADVAAVADDPPDGSIVLDPASSDWQRECAVIMARAVRTLAKRDPRFATTVVATGEIIQGTREVYLEREPAGVVVQLIGPGPG